jgi:hypothetical protein
MGHEQQRAAHAKIFQEEASTRQEEAAHAKIFQNRVGDRQHQGNPILGFFFPSKSSFPIYRVLKINGGYNWY